MLKLKKLAPQQEWKGKISYWDIDEELHHPSVVEKEIRKGKCYLLHSDLIHQIFLFILYSLLLGSITFPKLTPCIITAENAKNTGSHIHTWNKPAQLS